MASDDTARNGKREPYPHGVVADRIEEMRHVLAMTLEEYAKSLGMSRGAYGDKLQGGRNHWSIKDVNRVSMLAREHLGEHLTGWPWFSLRVARLLDGLRAATGNRWDD